MNINYRIAERKDCASILRLIKELAEYEKAAHEVTVSLSALEEAGFGPTPVWKAFVAEDSEQGIIGFALFYIRFSTWKGQRIYLEDFLVTESFRGKGIGKVLFELVLEESIKGPYEGMVWQVLDWNEPALNFYRKYKAQVESGWLNASLSKAEIKNL